uniref:NADH-ubiquinone oxidoreductase chain 2 n=1 Tax=Metschnikowia drosophilae TaxID=135833 RepID=A0A7H1CNH1_9ASCO|nr:Nad2 [Metschnikowia drosophilae]QNS23017.1 Nad2 [Metschnikowia drosophilae]QNS23027.1 Nad2 [Metschnikowia drosophilae]
MLMTSFLTMLVFSTYKGYNYSNPMMGHSMMLNRLGMMTMTFMLMLLMNSLNMMPLMPGMTLFNNNFNMTSYNLPMMMLMLLLMMSLLVYNMSKQRYDMSSPYYIMMMMTNMMGLMLFPLVNNLMGLYMLMELQSYTLYLLTGLHNRSYNASRASLLYFLMGGMASTMMLVSSYFMYNLTGSTSLNDMSLFYQYINNTSNNMNNLYFDMLLMALMFKMGLAPLHRWSMAVYNYAPTYMTAYMSMVAKLSIMSFMFANLNLFDNYMFMMFFYLSLMMGSFKPLFQMNIKTILAYSGLLNFGYILLSVITFDMSMYIYLMQYTLTHMIMFLSMLATSQYMDKPMSNWSPLMYMHQLKMPNKGLMMCLMLSFFSLMGMPPLPGFYAKLYILIGSISYNYILESLLLMTCSVMATYYYANMIKMLASNFNSSIKSSLDLSSYYMNSSLAYIMSMCTILMITLFIYMPNMLEGLYIITM